MDTSSNVGFILPSEGEVGHGGWFGSGISRARWIDQWMDVVPRLISRDSLLVSVPVAMLCAQRQEMRMSRRGQ